MTTKKTKEISISNTVAHEMQEGGLIGSSIRNGSANNKPRMKLSDFFYKDKHEVGTRMPIMLPSGKDSGEWLQVRGPDCDESIKAGRAYALAYRQVTSSMKELEAKCKEMEDFTEYNTEISDKMAGLNADLAVEIVTGWSFDESFSEDVLRELLGQYSGLADAIAVHHSKSREELSVK